MAITKYPTKLRDLERILEIKHRLRREGSSYSTVTTLLAFMFAMSLFLDLFANNRSQADLNVTGFGILVAISFASYCLVKGRALSSWVGITFVVVHSIVAALVIGYSPDPLAASANLQAMPLMAMYLAWFYPKRLARPLLAACVAGIIITGTLGPGSYLDTSQALHEVIRLVLFMTLSIELGILWRSSAASDSNVDDLTGALTRNELVRDMSRELQRQRRYGTPFAIALIDLDNFKAINDLLGHSSGDDALREVVQELKVGTRATDTIYRFGGDEFVLLLPNTSAKDAQTLLSRSNEQSKHLWSWGVAGGHGDQSIETLLERADQAMFEHKTSKES